MSVEPLPLVFEGIPLGLLPGAGRGGSDPHAVFSLEVRPHETVVVLGDETSGVDNWLEEGGPLEPEDFVDSGDAVGPSAEVQLAERTADLQRLQAEYANYRKRVDRDRQLISENATYCE